VGRFHLQGNNSAQNKNIPTNRQLNHKLEH